MPRIISPKKARQGRLGRPVLVVLCVSLFLCLAYLVGMVIWAYGTQHDTAGRETPTETTMEGNG